jgi:hypothetical protein
MDETGNETNEAAAPAGGAGSDMKRLRLMLLVLVLLYAAAILQCGTGAGESRVYLPSTRYFQLSLQYLQCVDSMYRYIYTSLFMLPYGLTTYVHPQ